MARAAAALALGDDHDAASRHEEATRRDGWRWLPVEHRAVLAQVVREPTAPPTLVRLAATLGVG